VSLKSALIGWVLVIELSRGESGLDGAQIAWRGPPGQNTGCWYSDRIQV
jgi:hypothetical protein